MTKKELFLAISMIVIAVWLAYKYAPAPGSNSDVEYVGGHTYHRVHVGGGVGHRAVYQLVHDANCPCGGHGQP